MVTSCRLSTPSWPFCSPPVLGPGTYSLDALLGLSGMWNPTVDWFVAGGAVVIGLANVALRRAVIEPVVTAHR
jgi:hypothetical protein